MIPKPPILDWSAFVATCARYGKDPNKQLGVLLRGYVMQVEAIERMKAKAANEQEKARLTEVVAGKARA